MFKSRFSSSYIDSLLARGVLHRNTDDGAGGNNGSDDAAEAAATADAEAAEAAAAAAAGDDADTGHKPTEAEAKLLKEVMKLKGKGLEAKAQAEAVTAELQKLKSSMGDLSLEDITKLIQGQKDAARNEAEKRGEYDRIVLQMKTENQTVLAQKEEQLNATQSQLNAALQTIEEMTIGREFSDSTYIRENSVLPPSIARKEFGTHFDNVDGKVVGYDKPRGAENRTPLVDASGDPKPFNEAIKALYESHADTKSLLKAKAKPGAGSTTDSGATKPATSNADRSSTDKISMGLKNLK